MISCPDRVTAGRRQKGAALLTTLIILSAISLIVISFLALSRHEATVSDLQVDDLRAELAVEAAFADAKALLIEHTKSDDYVVTAITQSDPGTGRPTRYTFLSQPSEETIEHIPLFAGGRTQQVATPLLNQASTASLANGSPNAPVLAFEPDLPESEDIRTFALTHLVNGEPVQENTRPATRLITPEPEPNGEKRIRYTYWIEDLEGLPNLDAIGSWTDDFDAGDTEFLAANQIRFGYSENDARTAGGPTPESGRRYSIPGSPSQFGFQFPREFRGQKLTGQMAPGLSPREIFPFPWKTGSFEAKDHPYYHAPELIARRYWAPGTGSSPGLEQAIENRFSAGLVSYHDRPLIPWGYGYTEAGQPRHSLNLLVAQRDLEEITRIINDNLPEFQQRAGGFPEDYVKTLAANVIDYADTDSEPTLGSGYRGVDSYPVVNEFYMKFEYELRTGDSAFTYRFTGTPYLEFWNPSNRPSKLENFRLKFEFVNSFGFSSPLGEFVDLKDTEPSQNDAFDNPVTISVEPNQYEIIELGEIIWNVTIVAPGLVDAPLIAVYDFAEGGYNNDSEAHFEVLVDSAGSIIPIHQESSQSFRFKAFYGSNVKDQSGRSPFRNGDYFWRGVPIGMTTSGVKVSSNYSDPWMGKYTSGQQLELYYVNDASPGGRNFRFSKSGNDPRFKDRQRIHDWPDRGYSSLIPSGPPKKHDITPIAAADLYARSSAPELAPFRINDSGRYWSVTELGHLHDHHMWHPLPGGSYDYAGDQSFDNDPENLIWDLQEMAGPDSRWGGGSTLRIGRKEFTKFDKQGMRASQLLDLFHSGVNGTNLTLGSSGLDSYENYDPRDHQSPPTARNETQATKRPFSDLYSDDEHAESPLRKLYGHLNLNSAPTTFEIEALLRGVFSSSAIMVDPETGGAIDDFVFEQEVDEERAVTHGLDPDACTEIAKRLIAARPFYSPSHLARVVGQLIHEEDAMPKVTVDGVEKQFFNDAEAEETFARLFNLTTLRSRHFRIFAYGEVLSPQADDPVVVSRASKVYEVFLEPVRDPATHEIERVECRILSAVER